MFKTINKISIKLASECNLSCEYCFQRNAPNNKGEFSQWNDLYYFVKNLPMKEDYFNLRLIGGETSLFPEKIREAKKVVEQAARRNNKKVVCGFPTNAYGYKNIESLIQDGTIDSFYTNISWDGLYGDELTRFSKSEERFSNEAVKYLVSRYGREMAVLHAIDKKTLPYLYESFKKAYSWGARKFGIYTIKEYFYDKDDIKEYYKQLDLIAKDYFNLIGSFNQFRLHNFNLLRNMDQIEANEDNMKKYTNCFNLGRIYHINTDGKIYPCILMGDFDIFCIGDLKNGIDKELVNKFIKELYKDSPKCLSYCKNLTCFECPASNYLEKNNLWERRNNMCNIISVEKDIYEKYKKLFPEKINLLLREGDLNKQFYDLDLRGF